VFTYIDLFAGCGGLSLGLQRAGGKHVLAVEKSPMAAETYFRNLIADSASAWERHRDSDLDIQVKGQLVVKPLEDLLNRPDLLSDIKAMEIDLVAGGPPCQGFSLAGRRRHDDPRNRLAWEFLDFVSATQPKFVVIENVLGIDAKFRDGALTSPFESLKQALVQRGYSSQGVLLNAVHYGAPQSRPRMMIIAVRDEVKEAFSTQVSAQLWKSKFADEIENPSALSLVPTPTQLTNQQLTVGDAIADLGLEFHDPKSQTRHSMYIREMKSASRWGLGKKPTLSNTDLRQHRDSTKQLFRLLQILTKQGTLQLARRARQSDFQAADVTALLAKMEPTGFPVVSPDRLQSVSDKNDLIDLIKRRLTLKHSQTVLDWHKPSRTVVTIPDDYIHPLEPRTFSVRELARLQGFPDSFVFHGKVTTGGTSRRTDVPQYTQVGNAVSPYVALAIGAMINAILNPAGKDTRSP
jgi:DNA (cytosine-5)-methyltransferase 1